MTRARVSLLAPLRAAVSLLVLARAIVAYTFTNLLVLVLFALALPPARASGIYAAATRWYRPSGPTFDAVARLDFWTLAGLRWSVTVRRLVMQSLVFPFYWGRRAWREAQASASANRVEGGAERSRLLAWADAFSMVLHRPLLGTKDLSPYFAHRGYRAGGTRRMYLWLTSTQQVTGMLWTRTLEAVAREDLALEDKAIFGAFLERHGLRGPRVVALVAPDGVWRPVAHAPDAPLLPPAPLFIKPVIGSGGKGTDLWVYERGQYRARDGALLSADALLASLRQTARKGRTLLVQEEARMSRELQALVGGQKAGFRIETVRSPEGIRIVQAVLKVARETAITDNLGGGGLAFPIDISSGHIVEAAFQPSLKAIRANLAIEQRLTGREIPRWRDIVATVIRAHEAVEGLCVAGWDLTLTDEGVTFFECNPQYDPSYTEAATGRPLGESESLVPSILRSLEHYCPQLESPTRAGKAARFPNGINEGYVPGPSFCRAGVEPAA